MLSEILLSFLKQTFSHADHFSWLGFTFDKNKKLVTRRRDRAALLDRLSSAAYLFYVATQTYGILWHNKTSSRVQKLNSALSPISRHVSNHLVVSN